MTPELSTVDVGDCLPTVEKSISRPQLFRYSAITWNAHRIHYDPEYARSEGHPDVLVQQHLHGAVIQELVMDWLGDDGFFESLQWKNVDVATPDQTLYVEAEVVDIDQGDGRLELEVWTRTDDSKCAMGTVTVSLE